jgi:hypothetical protein
LLLLTPWIARNELDRTRTTAFLSLFWMLLHPHWSVVKTTVMALAFVFLQSRACIAYPALSNISRISLWFRRVVSSKFRPDWYRTVSGANSKLSSCVNSNTPWTSCSAF